jgi:hypothetical protein
LKTIAAKKHSPKENGNRLTYELTYKDVVDILETIDHSTFGELHIELGDFKLTVCKKKSNPATLTRPSGSSD